MAWLRRWPRLVSTCFIVLILLEILAFLWVADKIGLALTLLALIGSAVSGLWLIRRTGLDMVARLRLALAQGQEPGHSLVDGACFVIAGLLLILPGFFSDLIALLLMLPATRNWLIRRFAGKIVGAAATGASSAARTGRIITDVEFREVTTPPTAGGNPPASDAPPASPAADAPTTVETPAVEPEIFVPARSTPRQAGSESPGTVSEGGEVTPAAEPDPAAETEAEDARWGRAPRRPIIDVEES